MKYYIAYDIVSDKKRKKISDLLSGYGCRVQFSVFKVELTLKQLASFQSKCSKIINKNSDSILFIPVCLDCEKKISFVGQPTHIYTRNFLDV